MNNTDQQQDIRTLLFLGNRWIRSVYSNYGIIKQRILLQLVEQCQPYIKDVMHGKKVQHFSFWKGSEDVLIDLDMSKITGYNNYFYVRKALGEMTADAINVYSDVSYKQNIYKPVQLLHGWEPTNNKRIVKMRVKRAVLELLLHVDYKNGKAQQYTKFDRQTITHDGNSSKYTFPLYTMICSYGEKGGFTIPVEAAPAPAGGRALCGFRQHE